MSKKDGKRKANNGSTREDGIDLDSDDDDEEEGGSSDEVAVVAGGSGAGPSAAGSSSSSSRAANNRGRGRRQSSSSNGSNSAAAAAASAAPMQPQQHHALQHIVQGSRPPGTGDHSAPPDGATYVANWGVSAAHGAPPLLDRSGQPIRRKDPIAKGRSFASKEEAALFRRDQLRRAGVEGYAKNLAALDRLAELEAQSRAPDAEAIAAGLLQAAAAAQRTGVEPQVLFSNELRRILAGATADVMAQAALVAIAQAQMQATAAPAEVLEAVAEQAAVSMAVQPSAVASLDVSAWMEEGVEEEPPSGAAGSQHFYPTPPDDYHPGGTQVDAPLFAATQVEAPLFAATQVDAPPLPTTPPQASAATAAMGGSSAATTSSAAGSSPPSGPFTSNQPSPDSAPSTRSPGRVTVIPLHTNPYAGPLPGDALAPDPNALPATHGDGASAGMARQLHAHFGAAVFPFPWQLVQYNASACDTVGATQGSLSQDLSGMELADDEGGGGGAGPP